MIKTKTTYHIDLAKAKEHLRIDPSFTADDNSLNGFIKAAHNIAEDIIEKDITLTNVTFTDDVEGIDVLTIDEGNFIGITSLKVDDVDYTDYEVTPKEACFVIEFDEAITGTLEIQFQTGYEANKCPEAIKQAILLIIGELYDVDRNGYVPGSFKETKAADRLLMRYKKLYF